jgi:hypothetical protein
VMSDEILVHAFRRTACRKTKHERLARSWVESLDTIWKD